jgi:hypothetical protein
MNTQVTGSFNTFEAQRQVRDSKLSKHAKAVAMGILTYANARTGIAFPSVQTLANGAGISPTSVRHGLRELKQASPPWLETIANANGGRMTTTYRFVMRDRSDTACSQAIDSPNAQHRAHQCDVGGNPGQDTQPNVLCIRGRSDAFATPTQHADELLIELPSETTHLKLTTTTNTREQQRHELSRLPRGTYGGVGVETLNQASGNRAELQEAIAAMPGYISLPQRRRLAEQAIAFTASMDGVSGADIIEYLDNITKTTSPQARGGSFVNILKAGKDAIDEGHFAAWIAEKPKREMLRWLKTTTEGKAKWNEVFTPDKKRHYPTEHVAMSDYVDVELAKQARGGAA